MNNVYDILEKCLLEIEQGDDVDTVLFRHPEFADELRPILEASIKAVDMAEFEPSSDVVKRNRAKVLQRAAEMREAKVKPISRIWFSSLRRITVTLAVVAMLFISGTELVRAASNTIPGDDLYPVKRTWEDVLLLFTFDPQERELLEFEHENERLEELNELFTEGRSVRVDFAGYVTRQSTSGWRVSGISVLFSDQTDLPNQPVALGDAVRIIGHTQSGKTVLAERIELLPVGMKLPEVEDDEPEHEEEENHEEQNPQGDEDSNSGSESEHEAPQVEVTKTPEAEDEDQKESSDGVLESIDDKNKVWTINGQPMDVSTAEIKGTPVIGAITKVEGYFNSDGIFVVTKIEIIYESGSGDSQDDSNDNNNDDKGNDDDDDDDNDNESHDNENSNENVNG